MRNMKKGAWLAGVTLAAALAAGCGGKTSDGSNDGKDTVEAAAKPFSDPGMKMEYTARLGGKDYSVTVKRAADPSQPVVEDELGREYYDNRVTVTILRDGAPFSETTYTKDSFRDFLTAADSKGTVLLGMAFDADGSDGHAIRLTAQVGQPGIEEGPGFIVEMPLAGGPASILRDKRQDTAKEDLIGD